MFSISSTAVSPGFRRRRFKRIQIHHHQIDRRDSMFRRLLLIFRMAAAEEQAAVHFGCKASSRVAQHSGQPVKSGNVGTATPVLEATGRPACRENVDLSRGQPLRKFHNPVLSNPLMSAR